MTLAAGTRRAALVALLAVAAVSARVAVADDFFSPLAPMLSPVTNSICKMVSCGKGNCTVEQGTVLGYRCECDPGWTQMHVGDSLRFMPCAIPNCTIDRACSNDSSAPAPAPSPASNKNFSLNDPCEFAYCGTGGTCRKGSGLSYHCDCKEGFSNLLNSTSMPCFQNCSIGADCASIGIFPSTNNISSVAPPSLGSISNSGNAAAPGSIPQKIMVPLLLLVSLALCQAM
jgi:hypothetical protein